MDNCLTNRHPSVRLERFKDVGAGLITQKFSFYGGKVTCLNVVAGARLLTKLNLIMILHKASHGLKVWLLHLIHF